MIGPISSRAPASAASIRDLPMRTCRSTFSTTTIASSTTSPTDNTIASGVKRLRLKPNANMNVAAPTSETGIATSGTSAVRTEPMKRNTTNATIRIVSDNVLLISVSAFRMNIVPSQTSYVDVFWQRRPDTLHLIAQPVRDLDLVRTDQRPDPKVDTLFLV